MDGGACLVQTGLTEQKVVVFRVGSEEYAVAIGNVREVNSWIKPTPVPDASPVVEGVIDLRGDVIPVIDLARLFRTSRRNADSESKIMVVEVGGQQAGLVVDDVTEVQTLAAGAVAPPSPVWQGRGSGSVVSGIAKLGENRLVLLVEVERILAGI